MRLVGSMRFGRDSEMRFHSEASLYQVVEHQRRKLREEIARLTERELKASPLDGLVGALAFKYSINVPILDETNPSPARREVDLDASRDPRREFLGGPVMLKGTEIAISVPYSGDREMFRFHPSNHVVNYPIGVLGDKAIIFTRQGANLDAALVRREFDAWLAIIKEHLDGMRKELGNFNDAIKSEIANAINARLGKIKRDDDLLGGLGFGGSTNLT